MRIRHLTTGRYLGVNDNKELCLVSRIHHEEIPPFPYSGWFYLKSYYAVFLPEYNYKSLITFVFYTVQTARRKHFIHHISVASNKRWSNQGQTGRQGLRSDRIAHHQVRRHGRYSTALRIGAMAELQKLRNEKERCWQSGREASHSTLGGQNGRLFGIFQITRGRIENGTSHKKVQQPFHKIY